MMSMDVRSKKRTAAGAVVAVVILFLLVIHSFQNHVYEYLPPSSARSLAAVDDNPHFWNYAYVIVTYHKSGHILSHTLRDHLQKQIKTFGVNLRRNSVLPRRKFNVLTKCSDLTLGPGTVTIIEAPEFHCHEQQLANILMDNPDPKHFKLGVKIIHLVRNPFSMAVSNYNYHSQDPSPEPFVHWKNPCSLERKYTGPVADLVTPVLSSPMMGIRIDGELPARPLPIMTHQDFDNIFNDCNSLYQTKPGLKNATYYEHLRALDPTEGLRMATTDKFTHIALMANDLLMFSRVKQLERERCAERPWRRQKLHLITMPMQDWIDQPRKSMYKYLEFLFHGHMPDNQKHKISKMYESNFFRKSLVANHITTGQSADSAELMEHLRRDAVFGGPLARIEALLEEVLQLESVD